MTLDKIRQMTLAQKAQLTVNATRLAAQGNDQAQAVLELVRQVDEERAAGWRIAADFVTEMYAEAAGKELMS